jgi:hypothetical protein
MTARTKGREIDPFTAALNLANTTPEIIKMQFEAMTPEQRAAAVTRQLEILENIRKFIERIENRLHGNVAEQ